MLSIYVNDKTVYIMCGTSRKDVLQVTYQKKYALQDGWVVNGFIQKPDEVKNLLQESLSSVPNKEKKEVVLTVATTTAIYRDFTAGKLRKNELDLLVYYTMKSQISGFEEYAMDYTYEDISDKQVQVIACSVPKRLITEYTEVLKSLKFSRIRITGCSYNLLNWVKTQLPPQKECYVIGSQMADSIHTILLKDNRMVITNNMRIGSNQQRENALVQRISQVMQFQRAKDDTMVTKAFLTTDFMDEETAAQISLQLGVEVEVLNGNCVIGCGPINVSESIMTLGALIGMDKPVDLTRYERFEKERKKAEKTKSPFLIALLILNIVTIAGLFGYGTFQAVRYENQSEEMKNRLQDPAFQEDYEKSKNLQLELQTYQNLNDQLDTMIADIAHKKAANKTLIKELEKLADHITFTAVTVNEYEVMQLDCVADTRDASYRFVEKLHQYDKVTVEEYDGFTCDNKTYRFSVTVRVNP
ncbi:MAG: hypothetical protein HUJ58_05230 [Erysipelotrichaceae bacterium]|nr:hypothetical protein [Erysipelotrichaceae bacterium]